MQTLTISEQNRDRLQTALIEWGLPPEVAEEASERPTLVSYPKGGILFLQGSSADFLFCILSGFVGIYSPQSEGDRILFSLAGPDEIVGQHTFPNDKNQLCQWFEAHARTRCEVALINRAQVMKLLSRLDSAVLLSMLNDQHASSSRAMAHWIGFLGLVYRQRLELVLADLAKRFGVRDARGVLLIPEVDHEDFAEMIDCSRPMVSKLINDLTAKRQIARCGKKYLLLDGFGSKSRDEADVAPRPSSVRTFTARASQFHPEHTIRARGHVFPRVNRDADAGGGDH